MIGSVRGPVTHVGQDYALVEVGGLGYRVVAGPALLAAAEANVPIDEPTPNEVKQTVCGNGSADKAQVAAMVERLLNVSLAGVPDDATDALAIAIGCAYRAASEPKAVIG